MGVRYDTMKKKIIKEKVNNWGSIPKGMQLGRKISIMGNTN
jgi:hypothetical protein